MAQEEKNGLSIKVALKDGVSAEVSDRTLTVKGKKGEVKRTFADPMLSVLVEGGQVVVRTKRTTQRDKKMLYTTNAHIKNMVKGAQEGHMYRVKICSSHFPINVAVQNGKLIVKNFLGEKHPRTLALKEGASVKVDGQLIVIESPSKEIAGMVASDIEKLTRRANFDPRIFQDGLYIVMKDGKEVA